MAALPGFSPANCATAAVCLAVMRAELPGDWAARYFGRVSELMGVFRAQELANVLTAAGERAWQGDWMNGSGWVVSEHVRVVITQWSVMRYTNRGLGLAVPTAGLGADGGRGC